MRLGGRQSDANLNETQREHFEMTLSTRFGTTHACRAAIGALLATAALLLAAAAPARAEFGIKSFDVTFLNEDGTPDVQAGSHPFAANASFTVNHDQILEGFELPDAPLRDFIAEQMPGLVGDVHAVPLCSTIDFFSGENGKLNCPDDTVVGIDAIDTVLPGFHFYSAMYDLVPPPGVPVRIGLTVLGVRVILDIGLKQSADYNVIVKSAKTSQIVPIFQGDLQFWGVPGDPAHDSLRGHCAGGNFIGEVRFESLGNCSTDAAPKPFLTLPRSCSGPQPTNYAADSWANPGSFLPDGEPNLADPRWEIGRASCRERV